MRHMPRLRAAGALQRSVEEVSLQQLKRKYPVLKARRPRPFLELWADMRLAEQIRNEAILSILFSSNAYVRIAGWNRVWTRAAL